MNTGPPRDSPLRSEAHAWADLLEKNHMRTIAANRAPMIFSDMFPKNRTKSESFSLLKREFIMSHQI